MIDRWFKRRQRDRSGSSLPVEERTHVPSPPSDPAPSRHAEEGHDGQIWVDAVGKIQVRNPRSRHGHYPVMVVPDSDWLSVSVNRSPVIGERVVEQNSRIQVRLLVQAPQSQVTVTIAPDGMEATLHVSYVSGERRALMPTKPSTRLVLEARRIAIEPPPVTLAQVRTELSRAGITAGLVPHAAIESFLARHESGSLVVARGVPPYPGGGTLESFRPDGLEGPWVVDLIFTRSGRFSKLWKKEGRLARFRVWRKRCQNGGSQLDTSGEAHDDSPSRDVTGEARGLVC